MCVCACVIGVSFTCQFVQHSIALAIFSCMCGQRETTTVTVFVDTLSAPQTRKDGIKVRACKHKASQGRGLITPIVRSLVFILDLIVEQPHIINCPKTSTDPQETAD